MAKRQRKRGGFIRSRGEGKWLLVLSWTDDCGVSRQTSSSFRGTRQEAEAALAEKLRVRAELVSMVTNRITFGDYLQVWMRDHVTPNLALKTAANYQSFMDCHVIPGLGHHQLRALRPTHIQRYLSGKLADPTLSRQSVLHHFRMIHAALAVACRWQYITTNPAAQVTPPRVNTDERPLIEMADVARIVAAAADRPAVALAIIISAGAGLRRGEVIALTWGNVDLDGAMIRVRESASEVNGRVTVGRPKTKRSRRDVPIAASLVAVLRRERQRQIAMAAEFGDHYQHTGRVIAMPDGGVMRPTYLSQAFRGLATPLGIHGTFHDVRHSHASGLIAQGIDMVTVSERLGHASPVITAKIYAHVVASARQAATDASGVLVDLVIGTRD